MLFEVLNGAGLNGADIWHLPKLRICPCDDLVQSAAHTVLTAHDVHAAMLVLKTRTFLVAQRAKAGSACLAQGLELLDGVHHTLIGQRLEVMLPLRRAFVVISRDAALNRTN